MIRNRPSRDIRGTLTASKSKTRASACVLPALTLATSVWVTAVVNLLQYNYVTERGNNGSLPILSKQDPIIRKKLASLSCGDHGGPPNWLAQEEMVFWSDIPADDHPKYFTAPFRVRKGDDDRGKKYMTAEFGGGWNNIRMGLETAILLSHALGRTLVLPPEQGMYLMEDGTGHQRTQFSMNDFYHLDRIVAEHRDTISIISMDEFLSEVAMKGRLVDKWTQKVAYPPENRTKWDGSADAGPLWKYLRRCGISKPDWKASEAIFVFPAEGNSVQETVKELVGVLSEIEARQGGYIGFHGEIAVNAPSAERITELLGRDVRRVVASDAKTDGAMLIHHTNPFANFYSYLFFEDWRHDLWMKRFIRDHLRYRDELQCAAARVIRAIRGLAKAKDPIGNPYGLYDSFHVRRGDFAYKTTRVDANTLYANSKDQLTEGRIIYVATDESDRSFFDPLRSHYDLLFLEDFTHLLGNLNTNYYGIIDQLLCSRGRVFFGTWKSTFSAYINRLRAYRAMKENATVQGDGSIDSYYFAPIEKKFEMKKYSLITSHWTREFPAAWQDIDMGA